MVFLGRLAEDFQTAYEQVSRGEAIHLPPKTTCSSSGRNAYRDTRSQQIAAEQDYWLAERKPVARLPVDYSGEKNTVAAANTISLT